MNEENKNMFLDCLLKDGESYKFKIWGTIMPSKSFYLIAGSAGALGNQYCYIGQTENSLNFVIVDSIRPSQIVNQIILPLNSIENKKIKKSIIPSRKVVVLTINGEITTISLMSNAIGSNIKNQKEGVEIFIQ